MNLFRGIIDIFPEIDQDQFFSSPKRIKLGIDPTSNFLHLGHSILLRRLGQFQNQGHQPILIIGDFTATIGDPTGKSQTRKQLNQEEVNSNLEGIIKTASRFLDINKTEIIFNSNNFRLLDLQTMIRLQSSFTVQQMLAKQDFNNRVRSQVPIGLHEFMYPLLQGFDSHCVNSDVELGGIDQKFNVTMGRTVQRDFGCQHLQIGMLMPILVGTDGVEKMSKSLNNAIGIDDHPLLMFSRLEKIPDNRVNDFITLLTDCDLSLFPNHLRKKQIQMAFEVVKVFHGEESAKKAQRDAKAIVLGEVKNNDVPEIILDSIQFPISFATLLKSLDLVESSTAARRLIKGGAIRLNGIRITNENLIIKINELNGVIIQLSKKQFYRFVKT